METPAAYPHIRFSNGVAFAFPRPTSPATAWLGSVSLPRDTPAGRRRAEKELREMFPAPAPESADIEAQRAGLARLSR